ncbi:response regulator [Candidatus Gracilibacteria bacterium CG17_big_fil_post_rev_8_21_14_2_50_48_13]|nr:MAG: response regulator [Candidatus Gracilibacteria bacterium CG17_big_fil_post_rev_8_21_14_2_50_48_13]
MSTKESKTILIVEDEKPLVHALQLKLGAQGFHVLTAEDGEAALALLETEQVDLILLDLVMPKVDGFQVLAALAKKGNTVPVVVASNLGQEQDVKRAKEFGVKDYFIKSNTSLADVVEKITSYV